MEGLVLLEVDMCGYEINGRDGDGWGLVLSTKVVTARYWDLRALEMCLASIKGNRNMVRGEAVSRAVDPFGRGIVC